MKIVTIMLTSFRRSALRHLFYLSCLPNIAVAQAPQAGLINRDASAFATAAGKLYLVDTAHDQVVAISRDGSAAHISVGTRPDAVQFNNRTGMVYVVNPGSRNVSVIDSASDQVVATVPTAARPYAIAVDETINRVYVSNTFSNMLTVIDGATNTASNLKTGSADAIMVDSDRSRVYLLGYESDTLTELNPADGTTTKIPAGAMHLWGLARVGSTLYVSHVQDAGIAAIDLKSHNIHSISSGAMPCALAANLTRGELYIANYADGTVTVVRDNQPIATISVVPHPQSLTVDEDQGLLYVSSPQNNQVTVIQLASRRVLKTITIADHPYAVAIHPQSHRAYSVNISNNSYTPLKSE